MRLPWSWIVGNFAYSEVDSIVYSVTDLLDFISDSYNTHNPLYKLITKLPI